MRLNKKLETKAIKQLALYVSKRGIFASIKEEVKTFNVLMDYVYNYTSVEAQKVMSTYLKETERLEWGMEQHFQAYMLTCPILNESRRDLYNIALNLKDISGMESPKKEQTIQSLHRQIESEIYKICGKALQGLIDWEKRYRYVQY